MKNEEIKVTKNGKECINCAGIAYTTLYFSETEKSYEHHAADVYSCGGLVGTKNPSGRFPYLFLLQIYDVIRSDIKNMLFQINLHLV